MNKLEMLHELPKCDTKTRSKKYCQKSGITGVPDAGLPETFNV